MTSLEEDLVAYIDYEKYLEQIPVPRIRRQISNSTNETNAGPPPPNFQGPMFLPPPNFGGPNFPGPGFAGFSGPGFNGQFPGPNLPPRPLPPPPHHENNNNEKHEHNEHEHHEHHEHHEESHLMCADPENEVYQECGGKCVLGCKYATTSPGITISKHDCEKNDCVEGCFCKTGLVRHQTKCIAATECPIRKCHRDEVYVSIERIVYFVLTISNRVETKEFLFFSNVVQPHQSLAKMY